MIIFRMFQHLLPKAKSLRVSDKQDTWGIGSGHYVGEPGLYVGGISGRGRTIDRLFYALSVALSDARAFVDTVWFDLFSSDTRELDESEYELGLLTAATEADRRTNIASARQSTGGQGPEYLQDVVQAAGFPLYIHEWFNTPPPHDPRAYTLVPTIGTTQCGDTLAQCGEPSAMCDAFLGNDPLYLHNLGLGRDAPPRISDNSATWPYYLYWSAETFPVHAQVPSERRQELERLLLKICPAEQVLVALVDYV